MSPQLWVPGAAEPSLDDFVGRIHRQIEEYTASHSSERSHVEVELADGERLTLRSLSGEPGFGFLTLSVGVGALQLMLDRGAIRRITLGPADEDQKPGFALPGPPTGSAEAGR